MYTRNILYRGFVPFKSVYCGNGLRCPLLNYFSVLVYSVMFRRAQVTYIRMDDLLGLSLFVIMLSRLSRGKRRNMNYFYGIKELSRSKSHSSTSLQSSSSAPLSLLRILFIPGDLFSSALLCGCRIECYSVVSDHNTAMIKKVDFADFTWRAFQELPITIAEPAGTTLSASKSNEILTFLSESYKFHTISFRTLVRRSILSSFSGTFRQIMAPVMSIIK